jgi:hypothetical protein
MISHYIFRHVQLNIFFLDFPIYLQSVYLDLSPWEHTSKVLKYFEMNLVTSSALLVESLGSGKEVEKLEELP